MIRAASVEIAMKGTGAEAAARDLFSKGWFEAEWESQRDLDSPLVRARLLAIAGGCVTVADKVLGWWDGWRKAVPAAGELNLVLEGPGGKRVSLDTADRDDLVEVLRVLHAFPR
jgi:hypothetical protein